MISANTLLLIFIPVALLIRLLPEGARKYTLLCASIAFYALCDYRYILLVLAEVAVSYFISLKLTKGNKKLMAFGVIWALLFLCFFKYFNFFTERFEGLIKLIMPLGISYYSFKIIGYQVDIYRGERTDKAGALNYFNYIMFFPQIICGPIEHSSKLLPQLDNWKINNKISDGFLLIVSGMFKKYVIAERSSGYVSTVFSNYSSYPAMALWMGTFFCAMDVYCDFAGYSEIAIGIAKLMGIETEDNFKLPYFSHSIKEHWRRWHISLSTWLKDYVYVSLGGNRCSVFRQKINILLTFLVSGLWHGNGLHYALWGLYHGVFNIMSPKESKNKFLRVFQALGTFVIGLFGWVLFRANTMMDAVYYFKGMFVGLNASMFSYANIVSSIMPFTSDYSCLAYFITVMLMVVILFIMEFREFTNRKRNDNVRLAIQLVCIVLFGVVGSNSFLYANF